MHDAAPARAQPASMAAPLFVHQAGAGPPLLLIHGLMATGAMFQPVVPALATHYHVIVPDLRGHGRSGALPGPYTMAQLAQIWRSSWMICRSMRLTFWATRRAAP